MTDWQTIVAFITDIRAGMGSGGWIVAIGTAIYGIVQIYRLPLVQSGIAKVAAMFGFMKWLNYLLWDNLNSTGKMAAVALPTLVGTFLLTFATGSGWLAALVAGFGAVVTAMGNRKIQKIIFAPRKGPDGLPMEMASAMMAEDQRKTALKTKAASIPRRPGTGN
jgi:FtsH-binding integral membrane protein